MSLNMQDMHIENSQLINITNQLTGFYTNGTSTLNGLLNLQISIA